MPSSSCSRTPTVETGGLFVPGTVRDWCMGNHTPKTSVATSQKGLESMSGKGSRPRPFSVTQAEYDARWDAIFGRDTAEPADNSVDSEVHKPTRANQETQQVEQLQNRGQA